MTGFCFGNGEGFIFIMWLLNITCSMIFLLSLANCVCANLYDYDYDSHLDFTWTAATGPVNQYNVYVSIDDNDYDLVRTTTKTSYTLTGKNWHKYRMKVQAVDILGNLGPMSEESDLVFCRLMPWDTNSDEKIDMIDVGYVIQHFGKTISEYLDNNPDVNGDGVVNIFDLVIVMRNLE